MTASVYTIQDLSVIRNDKAIINHVSLTIEPGELTVILGPNGAGKSTLVSVLGGDIAPDAGHIALFGKNLRAWSTRDLARKRAVLPQHALLQFAFRAEEVVAMGRSALPAGSTEEEHQAIAAAMEQTSTTHLKQRTFPQLSGGEQSRVSFARVLTQETPVILLDEPTASLDLRHQHDVMTVAQDIARAGGTVIAIVHDINLACAYADRLILMDNGKIVASGTVWDVIRRDVLEETFGCPLEVITHPYLNCPLVLSTPQISARKSGVDGKK